MRVALPLVELDSQIERRSALTQDEHSYWPCRRGCDECCRTLSRLPLLVEAEWQRLRDALQDLAEPVRAQILAKVRAAPDQGPVVCPLLADDGSCTVYAARPVVCRMHGFYTERDGGLHCATVLAEVRAHGAEQLVVWGNGESVADALRAHGPSRSLRDWCATA